MIGLLLKKQWLQVFRSYHYNAKTNKARSKAATILYYALFGLLFAGLVGGFTAFICAQLCKPMADVGMGWLYFLLTAGAAVLLGAVGSAFNTYSGLYLAKDNDLLFSLPIPSGAIMTSRLMMVYLMGLLYSGAIFVPAMLVYWFTVEMTAPVIAGGILMLLDISLIDLTLSCGLGWIIARLSLKLKNKSIITTLMALVFIAGYYVICFRFSDILTELLTRYEQIGHGIEGSAYAVYLFGTMGTGNGVAMAVYTLAIAAVASAVWLGIKASFMKIATSTAPVAKTEYREKPVRVRSLKQALLAREFNRFTASANYMLNCGLGVFMLPLAGIALLFMGDKLTTGLTEVFGTDRIILVLAFMIAMMSTMIDPAAPSVSLEGKTLWMLRSLPVPTEEILKAKLKMQLWLSLAPAGFVALCGAVVIGKYLKADALTLLLFVTFVLVFAFFMANWSLFWGLVKANLHWPNEIYPIKQGMAVGIALLGAMFLGGVYVALYFLVFPHADVRVYLGAGCAAFGGAGLGLYLWLKKRGTARFEALA